MRMNKHMLKENVQCVTYALTKKIDGHAIPTHYILFSCFDNLISARRQRGGNTLIVLNSQATASEKQPEQVVDKQVQILPALADYFEKKNERGD